MFDKTLATAESSERETRHKNAGLKLFKKCRTLINIPQVETDHTLMSYKLRLDDVKDWHRDMMLSESIFIEKIRTYNIIIKKLFLAEYQIG